MVKKEVWVSVFWEPSIEITAPFAFKLFFQAMFEWNIDKSVIEYDRKSH